MCLLDIVVRASLYSGLVYSFLVPQCGIITLWLISCYVCYYASGVGFVLAVLLDRGLEAREQLGDQQADDQVAAAEDDAREDRERQPPVRHALHAPERRRPARDRRHHEQREERA